MGLGLGLGLGLGSGFGLGRGLGAWVRSACCAPLVQRVGELGVQRVVEAQQRRRPPEDDVEDARHLRVRDRVRARG